MRQRYIDLMDAGSAWAGFTLDIDDHNHIAAAISDFPPPNWHVETNRGAHLTWLLRTPVHKYDHARPHPKQYLKYISNKYGIAFRADPAFNGMGRNPFHPAARTLPGALKLYTLDELASPITGDLKKRPVPKAKMQIIGRNDALFYDLCRYAGRNKHSDEPLQPVAERMNSEMFPDRPLPPAEESSIAKSVEKYRLKWRYEDDTSFIERQRELGRMGGVASGIVRRDSTRERDAGIVAAHRAGKSAAQIARDTGLHRSQIGRILKLLHEANTVRAPLCCHQEAKQSGANFIVDEKIALKMEPELAATYAEWGKRLEAREGKS
ncbi:MAG: replication initiation protein [Gammaproteobacteria bacterium]|nr:replication initiation protein [Gammaproteobacteria bacterium]